MLSDEYEVCDPTPEVDGIDTVSTCDTNIEDMLNNYDMLLSDTAKKRAKIERVLMDAVACTSLNPEMEDIESVQKKVMVLESASRILDSREKSYGNRVALRMKRQNDTDMNSILASTATAILQKLQASNVNYVDTSDSNLNTDVINKLESQLGNLNPIADLRDGEVTL